MTPEETLAELLSNRQRSVGQTNATLQAIWPHLRAPQRSYSGVDLIALFQRAGYVSDGTPKPSSALTIYRGELVRADESGISWTADPQIAQRYARDYSTFDETRVLQATALPEAILARFKQEVEVVVAPYLLMDVTELGRMPHFTLPRLTPF